MSKRPPAEKIQPVEMHAPSLTLEDCYKLALRRSETLAMRKEDIEATEASFLKATGDAVGDVNFVMTNFRQEVPEGGGSSDSGIGQTFSARERRERRFEITQPIFQGFKAFGALSGSGSLRKQRQEEWRRAKQLLFLDVSNAFYALLRQSKDVNTIQGILDLFQDRIKELNEREGIGRSRPSELATARSRMKIIEAELAQSIGRRAVARHMMEFLVGMPVHEDQLIEDELPPVEEEKEEILVLADERADVEASRQAVKTARGAVIVAQSDLWPNVSIDSNVYEKREGFQSGIDWDLLFTVDVPLFTGGETVGNIKESFVDWKKAKLTHSLAQRQAQREIQDAYENWESSSMRFRALEEAMSASQDNFTMQKDEYLRNLVNNLDVLEALEALFTTRRDANQAFYEMKANYWQLQVAKGTCCESV